MEKRPDRPPPAAKDGLRLAISRRQLLLYRLRARLWAGPLSHLLCGLLDLAAAYRRYRAEPS